MADLAKVAIVGHSFVRRLDKDIKDTNKREFKRNFDLAQCQVRCRWSGGWQVLDMERFNGAIAPFLRDFRPDVVVLQLGGNDIDNTKHAVQSITVASRLEELAMKLINEFFVRRVYLCEIFTRNFPCTV